MDAIVDGVRQDIESIRETVASGGIPGRRVEPGAWLEPTTRETRGLALWALRRARGPSR